MRGIGIVVALEREIREELQDRLENFLAAKANGVLSVSVCNSPIAGRTGWLRRQPVAPVRVEGHHGVA